MEYSEPLLNKTNNNVGATNLRKDINAYVYNDKITNKRTKNNQSEKFLKRKTRKTK